MANDPYVIVLGNEKGGTGKSTISIHVIAQLLALGYDVGTIDIDARQGTLTSYLNNRRRTIEKRGYDLHMPQHHCVYMEDSDLVQQARNIERQNFIETMERLSGVDFIVIDTPGRDAYLSQLAHSYAHTIITPINDSFIDLDVLVKIEDGDKKSIKPSIYANTIWEQKKQRLMRDRFEINWVVVRNRLSHIQAKNKAEMNEALKLLSGRIGFKLASGFAERVIFRELFLKGMTLVDLEKLGVSLSMSHIAAKQEMRNLLNALNLPTLKAQLNEMK